MALELALQRAPGGQWQQAACSYGLLIAVLQAVEGALRRSGLQRSGDQLHHLLVAFLQQQRRRGLLVGDAPPAAVPQAMQQPRRTAQQRGRRRIPGAGRFS
jgi:hypothetical protein